MMHCTTLQFCCQANRQFLLLSLPAWLILWVRFQELGQAVPNIVGCRGCVYHFRTFAATWTKAYHKKDSLHSMLKETKRMGLSYVAGSHEVEVSSGVHSRKRSACSPSRLSRKAATSNADEKSSSLQTLAAAADRGELNPRPTVTLAVALWCMPLL